MVVWPHIDTKSDRNRHSSTCNSIMTICVPSLLDIRSKIIIILLVYKCYCGLESVTEIACYGCFLFILSIVNSLLIYHWSDLTNHQVKVKSKAYIPKSWWIIVVQDNNVSAMLLKENAVKKMFKKNTKLKKKQKWDYKSWAN